MESNGDMNMENDYMPEEMNQQQMPMGQSCPYMNQGMCTNPDMMYQQPNQQPFITQIGYPRNYNYPQQNQGNLNDRSFREDDDSREFSWDDYPYGNYFYGGYPYGGSPYGGYPYDGYYGHGWHNHNHWHGHR